MTVFQTVDENSSFSIRSIKIYAIYFLVCRCVVIGSRDELKPRCRMACGFKSHHRYETELEHSFYVVHADAAQFGFLLFSYYINTMSAMTSNSIEIE